MLLDERPLVLLPSLANAVGIAGAVVVQQVHFHLANPNNGRIHDGEQWIFKTYEDWHKDDFPFWSERTIRRLFCTLERRGLIVSCQPEGRDNRRKYYRIDYGRLEKAFTPTHARVGCGQNGRFHAAKSGASSLSETTRTETTQNIRVGARAPTIDLFLPRIPYPESAEEMYDILEAEGVEIDPDHDGNFFEQMQASNWTIRGEPVWDWIATYKARLEVTAP
jgi:hypothetical protein